MQLSRVKSNGMSIRKLQLDKSKPAKFCQQKHRYTRLFRRITRPFIPLLIFRFTFQRLVREKFHFKTKKSTVSLRWSKMSSLQVFHGFRSGWNRIVSGKNRKIPPVSGTNQIAGF